jgi:hypothetical protein
VGATSIQRMSAVQTKLPIVHTARSSSSNVSDSNDYNDDDLLHSTAPGEPHRPSIPVTRDSGTPPTMSSYFCVASEEDADADAGPQTSPLLGSEGSPEDRDEASFEEIPTPRSIVSASLVHSSRRSRSPLPTPAQSRITVDRNALSLPLETVAVNELKAREAHVQLLAFSAATMAQYHLVKLKVRQRIYRIYYDKWRRHMMQHTPPRTPSRLSKVTQTPSVQLRSVSIGTDFVDMDSFHASRAASAASTPRSFSASARTPGCSQPSCALLENSSPPPHRAARGRQNNTAGIAKSDRHMQPLASPPLSASPSPIKILGTRPTNSTCSPSPSVARLQSSLAHTPSPDVHPAHEWPAPLTPPPTDGIAVRTKPSKLVDFGRHSEVPRRKSAHVSNPVVTEPRVVPSPQRIFRL